MSLWSRIQNLFRKPVADDADDDSSPSSLVLLLREPRSMEAEILRPMVERAFDVKLDPGNDEATSFVAGEPGSPLFMIRAELSYFYIHNYNCPYLEDMDRVPGSIRDRRMRTAIAEHAAWCSVDAMVVLEDGAPVDPYPAIGKLIAELIDDNCVAVYAPATNQFAVYDPGMEQVLCGPEPLSIFQEFAKLPIVDVGDDDPEMAAAQAEARRRWPEFVAAFENRNENQLFAVKAPFRNTDNCEFMWVTVTGIENDVIYGILDNDPGALPKLQAGDTVRIPTADLNDWMIAEGDDLTGGFTVEVLTRRFGTDD